MTAPRPLSDEQRQMLKIWNCRREFAAAQIQRDEIMRAARMAYALDLGEEADRLMRQVQDDFDREFGT